MSLLYRSAAEPMSRCDVSFADMPRNNLNWHYRHVIPDLDLCQRPVLSGKGDLSKKGVQVLMLRLN